MIRPDCAVLRRTVSDPYGSAREAVLLRITDEAGHAGWGEASPLPGYSPDDVGEAELCLRRWADAGGVDGAEGADRADGAGGGATDALDDGGGGGALDAAGGASGLAATDLPDAPPSARCALDTASLDLVARRRGIPLRELLAGGRGARPPERLAVAAVVTLCGVDRAGVPHPPPDPEVVLERVDALVTAGYETIKFKIGGEDFAAELDQLEAVRAAHPALEIRLDVNGAWEPAEARGRLGRLAEHVAPQLVEQPVPPWDLLRLAGAGVPLAADESVRLPGAIDALAEAGSCVAIVLKPMVLGGLRECVRLAERAFERDLGAIVSHTMGGPIAHAAACELALALAALDPARGAAASGLGGHDELRQRAGPWLVAADLAGHGVEGPAA